MDRYDYLYDYCLLPRVDVFGEQMAGQPGIRVSITLLVACTPCNRLQNVGSSAPASVTYSVLRRRVGH